MSDKILEGWEEIASLTPFSTGHVRQKYGPEMIREGVVMKTTIGRGLARRPRIWAYPSYVRAYFSKKLSKEEGVKG